MGGVTAKEKVLELAPQWSEHDAEVALRAVESEHEDEYEWAMKFLDALDAGEIDGYDFSVSQRLHAER